jgi:dephospho-CoA kinase
MKKGRAFRIGLTGGIASGKSTVSDMLRQMGAAVVDTDAIAREVLPPGCSVLAEMSRRYGPEILQVDGSLRRDVLGRIIFSEPKEKKWVEELMHPLIRARAEELAQTAVVAGHSVVVFDVPLLFEAGWDKYVDSVWTVYVSQETQRARLKKRDCFADQEIAERMASQLPIDEKEKRADVVINNEGTIGSTRKQVETAWRAMEKHQG